MNDPGQQTRGTILMATFVPFWRQDTGSAQRIGAMCDALCDDGYRVSVYYLARLTASDGAAILSTFPRVCVHQPSLPLLLLRKLRRRLRKISGAAVPLWRDSFREDRVALRRLCEDTRPAAVIAVYASLEPLVRGLKGALDTPPLLLVDTIDSASMRTESFAQRSLCPVDPMTQEEETKALTPFDVVVAIQEEEAGHFRALLPGKEVLVAGHPQPIVEMPFREGGVPTVLFVGAVGEHNQLALRGFLEHVWPGVYEQVESHPQLDVVGAVCGHFDEAEAPPGVRLRGFVEDVTDAYREADVVINPAFAGSGLKIKNVEALAHGKPLVTTPVGAQGLLRGDEPPFVICDTPETMVTALCNLLGDAALRRDYAERARAFARTHLSEKAAFRDLLQRLDAASRDGK